MLFGGFFVLFVCFCTPLRSLHNYINFMFVCMPGVYMYIKSEWYYFTFLNNFFITFLNSVFKQVDIICPLA